MKNTRVATRANARVIIQATPDQVWNYLDDPTRIADFHPLIRASRPAGNPNADRECDFIPMGVARERVVRTDNGLSAEMTGGKNMPPIEQMSGELTVSESGEGTEVHFALEYHMRPGLLPRIVNAMMVRPMFTKAPAYYVAGLKHLVERGSKASTAQLKRLGWINRL